MSTAALKSYQLHDHDIIVSEPTAQQYVLRVKDLPDQEKPRERLIELGVKNLSVPELMAIVWGVGTRKEEVLAMAKRTLKDYGEKAITNETSPVKLAETADIPLTKACQLVASFELGRRFFASQDGLPIRIHNATQAYLHLQDMGASKKEQLRGLYLNSRYQIIYDEVISVGSLTSNIVHPREVFQPAIEHGAAAVIIAHNHPSGDPKPSAADIEFTQQLLSAGKVLGIDLLDHLIITKTGHVSIKELIGHE